MTCGQDAWLWHAASLILTFFWPFVPRYWHWQGVFPSKNAGSFGHVFSNADVKDGCTPAEVAATTAHAATARPTIVTTTVALRRDHRDDVGFATSGAACDEICRGDSGEGRRPRALDFDGNGPGARACSSGMGSRRTAMLGFTFRGSRVSEFLSRRAKGFTRLLLVDLARSYARGRASFNGSVKMLKAESTICPSERLVRDSSVVKGTALRRHVAIFGVNCASAAAAPVAGRDVNGAAAGCSSTSQGARRIRGDAREECSHF